MFDIFIYVFLLNEIYYLWLMFHNTKSITVHKHILPPLHHVVYGVLKDKTK